MLSLLNYAFVLVGQFLAALFDFGNKREWNLVRLLVGCGVLVVLFTLLGYSATLPAMIEYFTLGGPAAGWQEPAGVITLVGWVSYLKSRNLVAVMLVGAAVTLPHNYRYPKINYTGLVNLLNTEFQHQRKFRGTLGDGDVYLTVSEPLEP